MDNLRVATAKTAAGRNRQVAEGRADITSLGAGDFGPRTSSRTRPGAGSEVHLHTTLNKYMQLAKREQNLASFKYNGNTYVKDRAKTGMIIYRKA